MRLFIVIVTLVSAASSLRGAEPVDFSRDVVPILQKYCAACHTEGDENGGLNMDTHASLMRGGESGLAITHGEPGSSRVLLMASGKLEPVMPPDDEEGPSEGELALLSQWIEQGAMGPDGDVPIRQELRTPKIPSAKDVDVPITSIALSRDGQLRAIARFGSVQILRADDSVVATLEDQPGKVNSLQFSKDGTKLLVASGVTGAYGLAAIHGVESGELMTEMLGHRDTLYAAALSPDETRVATAGYDREIVLWDASTGEPIRKFSGHNGAIFDLAFSPDGAVLASACADETVKIWHVETARRLDTLSQPEGEVFAVDITADGKFVLAGSADNRLRVWKLKSKQRPQINPLVATRFVDESPLVNFKLTPDGTALVVLSEGGHVKVVRTSDWSQVASLEPLDDLGSDLSISPDGSTATISLMNGTLVTRSLPQVSEQHELAFSELRPIFMDLGEPSRGEEGALRQNRQADPSIATLMGDPSDQPIRLDRGAE
ncbi:MAG: c-type cytochrome domain-containing protein, partial [Woeseiaceae bacterium]